MGRIFTFIVLATLTITAHGAESATGTNKNTFPLMLERGSRLTVAVKINGHALTALLDSAAEATLVDSHLARELKLDHGQAASGKGSGSTSFEATLVSGVTIEALGLQLTDQTVAVADLADIGRRLLHHRIDAILGREIFDAARLSIDIESRRISVVRRDRAPRGVRLDLVTGHGIETIPVRVESGDLVRATFDLGNGSHVLIGAAFAQRKRFMSDGRKVTLERGGGLGGETERRVFRLHTLEIAGRKFANVVASIDQNPSASDVNIGVSVLRHFRLTADFSQHAVWLDPRN